MLTSNNADNYQRPPRRPQCRRSSPPHRRLPIHREVRRGMSRQLEPRRQGHSGNTGRTERVSRQAVRCQYWRGQPYGGRRISRSQYGGRHGGQERNFERQCDGTVEVQQPRVFECVARAKRAYPRLVFGSQRPAVVVSEHWIMEFGLAKALFRELECGAP